MKVKKFKGSDGSIYLRMLALTQTGEPICLNEYATKIATNLRTQVILFEDWQRDTFSESKILDYINRDSKPQELVLESRHGRSRLHHVP